MPRQGWRWAVREGVLGLIVAAVSVAGWYGGLAMVIDKPGVYPNVDFADYRKIKAVNHSRLKLIAKSPAHYAAPFNISSPALAFGNLAHTGRLEPLTIAERYAVEPEWHLSEENVTKNGKPTTNATTLYVKQKRAEFEQANAGKELVTQEAFDRMKAICANIDSNAKARDLLNGPGPCELTIVWSDPDTGLLCKARIDKHNTVHGLVDLKTMQDITAFRKSIERYSYHTQAAFYREGWAVLHGGELLPFHFVAVESQPPHCVGPAPMGEASIEQGARTFHQWLERVAKCHEDGVWPGPDTPDAWELPEAALVSEPLKLTIGGKAVSL